MGMGRHVSSTPIALREHPYMHASVCTALITQRCRERLSPVQVQMALLPDALPMHPPPIAGAQ
jgi:hypothetical protein